MNRTVAAMQARSQFGSILNEVFYKGDIITIERGGKPMAALVPLGYLEGREKLIEQLEDAEDIRDAEASLAEGGRISHKDLCAELGLN